MVGGRIIEILRMTLRDGDDPSFSRDVVRLWVKDTKNADDELAVYVKPFDLADGPKLGEEIWWQAGKVMFDHDQRTLNKVGYSFDPRRTGPAAPATGGV